MFRGAARQFGAEFGRAGANAILKGKNYYSVKPSNYEGRIKPSDSEIVKAIKEIKKIDFVTKNQSNIQRLIKIIDTSDQFFEFKGISSLNMISDIQTLTELINEKLELGETVTSNDDSEIFKLWLKKEKAFTEKTKLFSSQSVEYVKKNFLKYQASKKEKNTALLLSFPLLIGGLGAHLFYLRKYGYAILYIILFPLYGLSILFAIYDFLKLLFTSKDNFDIKHNPEYVYFSQFNIKK